jgi:hypothetical protein
MTVQQYAHIPNEASSSSWSHYSEIPDCCKETPVILGVDEAGRGPVIGNSLYDIHPKVQWFMQSLIVRSREKMI